MVVGYLVGIQDGGSDLIDNHSPRFKGSRKFERKEIWALQDELVEVQDVNIETCRFIKAGGISHWLRSDDKLVPFGLQLETRDFYQPYIDLNADFGGQALVS